MTRTKWLPVINPMIRVARRSRRIMSRLTALPVTKAIVPAMYWQMPPKNIMLLIIILGASTPWPPIPAKNTRKILVAKERRPSGAGFARRQWYVGILSSLLSLPPCASSCEVLCISIFSDGEKDISVLRLIVSDVRIKALEGDYSFIPYIEDGRKWNGSCKWCDKGA